MAYCAETYLYSMFGEYFYKAVDCDGSGADSILSFTTYYTALGCNNPDTSAPHCVGSSASMSSMAPVDSGGEMKAGDDVELEEDKEIKSGGASYRAIKLKVKGSGESLSIAIPLKGGSAESLSGQGDRVELDGSEFIVPVKAS